jgi:hypothetical protein
MTQSKDRGVIVAFDPKTKAIWGIGRDEKEVRQIADAKIKELNADVLYEIKSIIEAINFV